MLTLFIKIIDSIPALRAIPSELCMAMELCIPKKKEKSTKIYLYVNELHPCQFSFIMGNLYTPSLEFHHSQCKISLFVFWVY